MPGVVRLLRAVLKERLSAGRPLPIDTHYLFHIASPRWKRRDQAIAGHCGARHFYAILLINSHSQRFGRASLAQQAQRQAIGRAFFINDLYLPGG